MMTSELTDQEIALIRKRREAITKGKWRGCQNGKCPCSMVWATDEDVPVHVPPTFDWADTIPDKDENLRNAQFIAHAPHDIDLLLATIDAKQERISELENALQRILNYDGSQDDPPFLGFKTDVTRAAAFDASQQIAREVLGRISP